MVCEGSGGTTPSVSCRIEWTTGCKRSSTKASWSVPELARILIESAISGSDEVVPADQRDYVRAIRTAPDAGAKIDIYAEATTAIAPRMALVFGIIQQAAHAEPQLAAIWTEIAERRAKNMHQFVADLAAVAPSA